MDLKKRIGRIMSERLADKLSRCKGLLLISAGLIPVAIPIVFGEVSSTPSGSGSQLQDAAAELPAFEVASIRLNKSDTMPFRVIFTPDGLRAENTSLLMILRLASGLQNSLDDKFLGIPAWAKTDRFNIEAKVGAPDVVEWQKLSRVQRGRVLQALLIDRFKLVAHHETKEQPVYALSIARNGPKLAEAKPGKDALPLEWEGGHMSGQSVPMPTLASALTQILGRTVLDKTGLTGEYDVRLDWRPEDASDPMFKGPEGSQQTMTPPASSGPSILTAVQEQLGLKLESTKGPVECLVIDHVELPSEN
jgi:uncharacterized protein (TIGR03435 family)